MDRIRWAVIGAGGIARRRTIPEGILVASNAELVAVFAPNSGAQVAEEFRAAAARSEEELLDFECDAVYVASPVDCHCRQVTQAAAAGRHVLCEKPLGLSVDEAKQMWDACHKNGVAFGCGLMMRFHPHHRRASEIVSSGDLGVPVFARAQLSCWYPPIPGTWRQDPHRSGGGALPDLAVHCIDALEMILGQRVQSVSCRLASYVHDYPVEDTCVLLVEFASGATATIDCLFNVPDQAVKNRLEIYGTEGSLLAEGTLGQSQVGEMRWTRGDRASTYDAIQGRRLDGGEEMVHLSSGSLYRSMIEDFGNAVSDGRPPFASGEQGLWLQRVLWACQLAARERRTVEVTALHSPGSGADAIC